MKILNKLPIKNIFFIDPVISLSVFSLCVVGLLVVFSTTYFLNKGASTFFYNQFVFFSAGFLSLFVIASIDYKLLLNKRILYLVTILTLVLLLLVLFIGELNFGARRWFDLGVFKFQPSEFAKLSVIFVTSYLLSKNVFKSFRYKILKIRSDIFPYFLSLVFVLLNCTLIFFQNSLGIATIIFLIYLGILYSSIEINIKNLGIASIAVLSLIAGVFLLKNMVSTQLVILISLILIVSIFLLKKRISILFILILVVVPISIPLFAQYSYTNFLQDYQKTRIDAFLSNDSELNLSIKWNEQQAITAVGSGLLNGKGFLKGTQSNIGYLPFAHTDFAFAAYAEQFGLRGSIFLFIIFFILFLRILYVGTRSTDKFGRYFCYGVAGLIFFNTVQHIGMNLGLLPITGVTLPLVSYGGSSNIVIFIGLGLVLSVKNHSFQKKIRVVDKTI